jgi:predicted dehydrogenase
LAAAGEVVFQAFCDLDPEAAKAQAAAFGARAVYVDHHAMFEHEELDALYLCIPPTQHTDELLLAADRGMALFVEKPQTLDPAQARRFSEAVAHAGVVSQVGFMSRYYPSAERARQLLRERTPRHALVQMLYSGNPVRYWTSRYELCGGSFVENTIHLVDLLRYLLGDIATVSAFYVPRQPGEGPEPMNLPHVYNVSFRFASGVVANVTTSRVLNRVPVSRRQVLIVSDDSLLEWSAEKLLENEQLVWQSAETTNPFARQAEAFVQAVRQGDAGLPRSPYPEALNSLAAVLGANASAEQGGRPIDLAAWVAGQA